MLWAQEKDAHRLEHVGCGCVGSMSSPAATKAATTAAISICSTGGYGMGGKRDLTTLLSDMTPVIARPTYVYCTFPDRRLPVGVEAICQFSESEGLTAIIDKSDAERLNIAYEFAARMITLTVHSDLAAVGFLSVVFATLANAGIACNAVSAYHHDHLFVPDERSDEAMSLLQSLSEGGGKR